MFRSHIIKFTMNSMMVLLTLSLASAPLPLSAEEPAQTYQYTPMSTKPGQQESSGGGLITPGETLTVEKCVDIALKKNPAIVAAVNNVDVNQSRVGEARSAYYPQLSATGTYDKISPVPGTSTSPFGSRPVYSQYTSNITLNQTIYDFGKTSSTVDVSKFNLESSRFDLGASKDTIALSVKQAYYGVLSAKRNRDVAADVIKQYQLHLDQAKGFYDVGTKAKIDVIKAEVDLSNAQLSLINAENALKIAWVTLNTTMGVPDAPEYNIEDNLSFRQYVMTLDEATNRAFANRPDLLSIIAKRQAAEANISLAKTSYYPILSGSAILNSAAAGIPPSALTSGGLQHGWDVGVALTIPLFSGFLTSHQVAEAKSSLYVLKANEETLRYQILLDVRQSFLNLQAAEASISTSELAATQAKENLDLANGRYAAGVGSPIEVSDAFATYVTAQAAYNGALYNYKLAQANIERAMGVW
ncbi:MAG TPA: TolC family protein [Nitrospirota bacterium]|nr:TolC family protein [Nitrospirota bacterium]